MLTGRRVDRRRGGHGVDFNTDNGSRTVHDGAGDTSPACSMSCTTAADGPPCSRRRRSSALYNRTWNTNGGADDVGTDNGRAKIDGSSLTQTTPAWSRRLTPTCDPAATVHLPSHRAAGRDRSSSRGSWVEQYLAAVGSTDQLVGTVLATIAGQPALRRNTARPADGRPRRRRCLALDAERLHNMRVPFMVWGPGVAAGRGSVQPQPQPSAAPATPDPTTPAHSPSATATSPTSSLTSLTCRRFRNSQFDADGELTVFPT